MHMAEMAVERGLAIDASCIWQWVQVYGPELDKRCRRHLKPAIEAGGWMRRTSTSKEEIAICTGLWIQPGKRIDFLLTDRRDAAAAKRFFRRAQLNEGT